MSKPDIENSEAWKDYVRQMEEMGHTPVFGVATPNAFFTLWTQLAAERRAAKLEPSPPPEEVLKFWYCPRCQYQVTETAYNSARLEHLVNPRCGCTWADLRPWEITE